MTQPASDHLLERLLHLHPKKIDLTLGRVERLLTDLGHPERALPPVIHVAGTNGKGSVIALLRAMLSAAGWRVHAYTSPHLVRFHERISLAPPPVSSGSRGEEAVSPGAPIDESTLAALLAECERVNDGQPITFFEITTAAAFLAFQRHPADLLLLETGLGGRLDATNLVAAPLASVLTPIGLDHQAFLGDSLEAIAGEKAGILKPGRPVVIGPQPPVAEAVLLKQAAQHACPVFCHGRDWATGPAEPPAGGGGALGEPIWAYRGARWAWPDLPLPALAGRHQRANAGLALAVLEVLAEQGWAVPEPALRRGLVQVRWPGRLQPLPHGPLAALLPPGGSLWLDGGHNEDAARALATTIAEDWSDRPTWLITGLLANRDPSAWLTPFAPHIAGVIAVPMPSSVEGHGPGDLANAAAALGQTARTAPSVAAALTWLRDHQAGPCHALICGSLYLAGAVLAENNQS